MKNEQIKMFYGDPKKLSSIKNAGELACSQPNLNAAKSLCRKKFKKPKFLGLKIKMRSYLFKNAVKLRQKRAMEFRSFPIFGPDSRKRVFL